MWLLLGIGAAVILFASGYAWAAIVLAIGIVLGLRAGRRWGFNQLGAFEHAERMRRSKSRQGGLGIF